MPPYSEQFRELLVRHSGPAAGHEVLGRGLQRAVAREAGALQGPKPPRVEARDLLQGEVAAGVVVAREIPVLLQTAEGGRPGDGELLTDVLDGENLAAAKALGEVRGKPGTTHGEPPRYAMTRTIVHPDRLITRPQTRVRRQNGRPEPSNGGARPEDQAGTGRGSETVGTETGWPVGGRKARQTRASAGRRG